jgi:glycosyltransferase involved in cell wall biosynthesis
MSWSWSKYRNEDIDWGKHDKKNYEEFVEKLKKLIKECGLEEVDGCGYETGHFYVFDYDIEEIIKEYEERLK